MEEDYYLPIYPNLSTTVISSDPRAESKMSEKFLLTKNMCRLAKYNF